jgi:hypothetical protein
MLAAAVRLSGRVKVQLFGPDGRLKQYAQTPNLVVNTGLYHMADQLADKAEAAMSHMAVGTGTTAPAAGDTALGNQTEDRHALDSKTQGGGGNANKVTYQASWAAGHATGAITEAGIFNSDSAGQMLCRATFPVINKGESDAMVLTWELTIS